MAVKVQHLRSSTADKRPTAANLLDGELSINTDAGTAGVFFENASGGIVKVGPCEVGTAAPNSSPAGSSGNSTGELWLDTASNSVLKIYDGSSFVVPPAVCPTQNTAPSGPIDGALWYDGDDSRLFVYYDDGSTQQWVSIAQGNQDYGLITGSVTGTLDYGALT